MATEDLDLILDSEYNNTGDLIGLDMELNGTEVLGRLNRMNPFKRFQVLRKITRRNIPSRGSRAQMEKHFKSLPKRIRAELAAGGLRLGDMVVYSIKAVNETKTIKMFETQDTKEVGLRNISNAKLNKNQALLVDGIWLLQGQAPAATAGSPTTDEIKSTPFGSIGDVAALANGEWSLKANKVQLVPETSMRAFVTDGNTTINLGYYKLDNPRIIHDGVEIEFTVDLGTTNAIPQDTFLYVGLDGTITTP